MKMKAVMKNHDRESDFWYTQANKLFVCISKNGIDFTMNASLSEIEKIADSDFINQSEAEKSSIISVMRNLLKTCSM
jgi:hypothetical protein